MLLGPYTDDSDFAEASLANRIPNSTTQFVSENIKSSRHTKYHLEKDKCIASLTETPLNFDLGLYIYHTKLINLLSDLNVSANYRRVTSIKKDKMQVVQDEKIKDTSIFIHSTVERNKPVFFDVNNIDLTIDRTDGERQLHSTGTTVYQKIGERRAVNYFFYVLASS